MTRFHSTSSGLVLIVTLLGLANLAYAQADPVPDRGPVPELLSKEEPDVFAMKVLDLRQWPDDELELLKVKRFLAAWEQYRFMTQGFRESDVPTSEMVQAVQVMVDALLAITKSDADRLRVLEQNVKFWEMQEKSRDTGYRLGMVTRSEMAGVKAQHLTAQIAVVEFKRAMERANQTESAAGPQSGPASAASVSPAPVRCDVCPEIGRRIPRRRRW